MKNKEILEKINSFIDSNWFFDCEEPDFKIINYDLLKDFLKDIEKIL